MVWYVNTATFPTPSTNHSFNLPMVCELNKRKSVESKVLMYTESMKSFRSVIIRFVKTISCLSMQQEFFNLFENTKETPLA